MLEVQMACWNTYVPVLRHPPEVILVDDGSPRTTAARIVRRRGCGLPLKVFRIKEDIPWNFAGARKLGWLQAEDWIYVSDIDTLLSADDARRLFEERPLATHSFYLMKRVWLPALRKARTSLTNLFFHKERYLAVGGYDEDYAGHYGCEESDFYHRLRRVARPAPRDDVVVRVVPPRFVADARTLTTRARDNRRNAEVFSRKEAAGFPRPRNPLRFTWERIL